MSADPALRRLTVRLRELKDATGLSLAALERKTPASKSAWGRYLNGQALPPRQVVAALGELAGADPTRLMALWELAAHTYRQPDTTAAGPSADTAADGGPEDPEPADAPSGEDPPRPAADPAPPSPPRRRLAGSLPHALALVIPTVLSTAALTIVITLVWHPGFGSAPPSPSGSPAPPAATSPPATAPTPSPRAAPTASPRTRAPGTVAPVQRRSRSSGVREIEGPYEPPINLPTHNPEGVETWTDGPPQPPDPTQRSSSGARRPSG
ncbi:helix-turn-helix domain-containing protein [Actinomadura kijaniata]|uniref:helix-turn-helix domain-containing protein n=1 Tax=Actinomadura kijaniata TaxID=46161 RepID=UPI003F1D347F